MTDYILIFVMTFIGALASIFLKRASSAGGIIAILKSISLYIGLFLYGFAAIVNIIVLKALDYSVVIPLTSITYIWTMILAYIILKEKVSVKKMIGVALIVIGAIFVVIK